MIRKIRFGIAAAIVACASLISTSAPANASSATAWAGGGVFAGNATTAPLWFTVAFCAGYPPALPSACASAGGGWNFSSNIIDVGVGVTASATIPPPPNPSATPTVYLGTNNVSGGGPFGLVAYCGAAIGSGSATAFGSPNLSVTFVSLGGNVTLVGTGGGGAAVASAQARPLPSGATGPNGEPKVPCVTEAATNYLVVGVAVGAGATVTP